MVMKRVATICLFLLFLSLPLMGQGNGGPAAAVSGPAVEASLGYAYVSLAGPSSQRIGLNGGDASGLIKVDRLWGATLDVTYARAADALGTRHSDTLVSGLVGPVFYIMQSRKISVFARALAGMSWINGAVPVSATSYYSGWEDRFSYAAGAGVQRSFSGPWAVRATGDYLRTTFVNATGATQGQNDLRVTLSLVYRFGAR